MSFVVGAFAIGLMVIVLIIAIFSLLVVASIPVGRFLQRRREGDEGIQDTAGP